MQDGLTTPGRIVRRHAPLPTRRDEDGPLRILVTGTNTFFGGRMVEGLGAAGCAVTAADSARLSCGKASKYSVRGLKIPTLRDDPGGVLDALLDELHVHSYDLLLPTFEEAVLLSDHQDELDPLVRTFLPPPGVAWNLHHKGRLHLFCRDVGIPTPATILADDPARWPTVASELGFPAFVKPSVGLGSIARSRCPDRRTVLEGFECVARTGLGVDPLLQRAIDGKVVNVLVFCHRGRVLGELLYRSLRTFPDDCGTSAHRESVQNANVSRTAAQLAEAAEWSGFVGLDIVVENGTGRTYLIDVNPRITPGLQLGFAAGVDWAWIVVDLMHGREPELVRGRPGVRARTVIFDTAWLIEGFLPKPGWLRRGFDRLRGYLKPGWELDAPMDMLEDDRRAHVAMALYTVTAVLSGCVRGCSLGDLLFRESTYDRRTVEAMTRPGSLLPPVEERRPGTPSRVRSKKTIARGA